MPLWHAPTTAAHADVALLRANTAAGEPQSPDSAVVVAFTMLMSATPLVDAADMAQETIADCPPAACPVLVRFPLRRKISGEVSGGCFGK